MKNDYEILKDKFGEAFAKLCRSLFPSLMASENLSKVILSSFAPSRSLYEDIINNNKVYDFEEYINNLKTEEKKERIVVDATPEELMAQAGYKLFKCENNDEVRAFKKYYRKDEALCTFRDAERILNYEIFFAVKNNVEDIRREDFEGKEQKDDLYDTSVISIQFTKRPGSNVSIKNRYNHTIAQHDCAFSNDLENIIPGLTESFKKSYAINVVCGGDFELPGYVFAADGKYYKYNYEIDNIFYCENNVVIKDHVPIQYDKSKYEIFDYFVLDKENKTLTCVHNDSFVNVFDNIQKIDVLKSKTGKRLIKISKNDGAKLNVGLDSKGRMLYYQNDKQKEIPNSFLKYSKYIKTVLLPEAETMGKDCLARAENLKDFYADNLRVIKDGSLRCCRKLITFSAKSLEFMGNNCLQYCEKLLNLDLPKVKEIGENCFNKVNNLLNIKADNLEKIGDYSFYYVNSIKELHFNKLKNMGSNCCYWANSLEKFSANNLERMGDSCFYNNELLKSFQTPKLVSSGDCCLAMHDRQRDFLSCKYKNLEKE